MRNCAQKKPSKIEDFISQKIPPKLIDTLNSAFTKSFEVIFDKGTAIIEKSYNKDELRATHLGNKRDLSLHPDRRRLLAFEEQAMTSHTKNVVISGVKGVGLGVLGIGLPDIPIFIGMVLKGIYEIALQYGFEYESPTERYFILSIIKTSLSYGRQAVSDSVALNDFMLSPTLPENYSQQTSISEVSQVLSAELLCMKFVQGMPIVGLVGGIADAVFVNKILSYANIKYKRRFLAAKIAEQSGD